MKLILKNIKNEKNNKKNKKILFIKMHFSILFYLYFCLIFADQWAVIVSGTYGYTNYRHQADACHNYNILLNNGFPKDHIILFIYDDVAYAEENPFKGHLYNEIGDNPTDVYVNCKPDYTGKQITPTNYLNVLLGNEDAIRQSTGIENPKVLKSNESDNIFLSFFNIGAQFVLGFPDDHLHADDLINTFIKMRELHLYDKILFFVESSESGSLFESLLPDDLNIYALTATNPYEQSWLYYCREKTRGINMNICLGDYFSSKFFKILERRNKAETIRSLYNEILMNFKYSHPMQYGDLLFENDTLSNFIGYKNITKPRRIKYDQDAISEYYGGMEYYQNRMRNTKNETERDEISLEMNVEITRRQITEERIQYIVDRYTGNRDLRKNIMRSYRKLNERECYYNVIDTYRDYCGYVEYGYKHYHSFANLCELTEGNENKIIQLLKISCDKFKLNI